MAGRWPKLVATYRLQLLPHLKLSKVAQLLTYLKNLGITHIYASPIAKARRGSSHGYDTVDPNKLNPAIGSGRELVAVLRKARSLGLGWIQDIVPNHMAFHPENTLLMNVLEFGGCSPFVHFFDIAWYSPISHRFIPLSVPVLRKNIQPEIAKGNLRLEVGKKRLEVSYEGLRFPLAVTSYAQIAKLIAMSEEKLEASRDIRAFVSACKLLKEASECWRKTSLKQVEQLRDRTIALVRNSKSLRLALKRFNSPGRSAQLRLILDSQNFSLRPRKVAPSRINYRRFANLNGFIALRNEDESVPCYTHRFVSMLLKQNLITGLRIDHIDGFFAPHRYLKWLKSKFPETFIVVEKILTGRESLPHSWKIEGTTGYDFLTMVNGIFVNKAARSKMDEIYRDFIGKQITWAKLTYECRYRAAEDYIFEIRRIASVIKEWIAANLPRESLTRSGIEKALLGFLAAFPTYRTYVGPEQITNEDRKQISRAFREARLHSQSKELRILEKIFLRSLNKHQSERYPNIILSCLMRLQQFTPGIVAKAIEDKAFYIFNRLLSLNEVGCDPATFGYTLDEFHRFNSLRLRAWPLSMNPTSTHDTKRSEDVRARLNVLSEVPDRWRSHVTKWRSLNRHLRDPRSSHLKIDPNDEYHLYQTLLGTLPSGSNLNDAYVKRIKTYMIKAVREAGVHTSWLRPHKLYEKRIGQFVENILNPQLSQEFLCDAFDFTKKVAFYGYLNSLAQVVLKVTCPGIPDFYQGCETWNYSLVDPDNRRRIDFDDLRARLRALSRLRQTSGTGFLRDLLKSLDDGRIKMFVTGACLQCRKRQSDLLLKGEYVGLKAIGRFKHCVISFARKLDQDWLLVVVPRFASKLNQDGRLPVGMEVWKDTKIELPQGAPNYWLDIFTGESLNTCKQAQVGKLLVNFPLGLLMGKVD